MPHHKSRQTGPRAFSVSFFGFRRRWNEQDREEYLVAAVGANRRALDLAQVQYRAGLADLLTVLDSERDLYATEDLLAQSQIAIVTDLVSLYKASGGGWSIAPQVASHE